MKWYGYGYLHIRDFPGLRGEFGNIGTCEEQKLDSDALEKMSLYYLVSMYKPNERGERGLGIKGSTNYRLDEYMSGIFDKSLHLQEEIRLIIDCIKGGLSQSIRIIIALDTTINKDLIIDGNKRLMAICYLKHKEPSAFEKLMNSKYVVIVMYMKSPVCRIIYPFDFLSLTPVSN